MTATPAKTGHANHPSRCTYRFSNGKRCRLFAQPHSTLCPNHAPAREAADLTATLTDGLEEFTSAANINDFLSRLLLLLAQDRISPRRGAVMAYTANLLLRSVSVMDQQTAAAQDPKKRRVKILWNIPGLELQPTEAARRPDDGAA